MGGWGSGRQDGKPLAEEAKRIDVSWMVRKGLLKPGCHSGGTLNWSCGGNAAGWIGYTYDWIDADNASITLRFTVKRHGEAKGVDHVQHVRCSYTVPTYGGRRWWMHCPRTGRRVAKLYCPAGGDIFACRQAWGIAYRSQRQAARDAPFEALFKIQRRLGCREGWEAGVYRPKGMWRRTYERHREEYWRLDEICGAMMMGEVFRLNSRIERSKRR